MPPFKQLTAFMGGTVIRCTGQKVVRSSALELQREARVRNAGMGVNTKWKQQKQGVCQGREGGRAKRQASPGTGPAKGNVMSHICDVKFSRSHS